MHYRDNRLYESHSSPCAVMEPGDDGGAVEALLRHHQAQTHVRRGICLLSAGQFDAAADAFRAAAEENPEGVSLPRYLAACYAGHGRFERAARELHRARRDEPTDPGAVIQASACLWKDGRLHDAIDLLRRASGDFPDSAEVQFQLGTLLAALDELEEAEMRFSQAIAMDGTHSEAMVSLALCFAARQRPAEAKRYLERAQARRPGDPRIGLLLAQAARCLQQQGLPVDLRLHMPPDDAADEHAIEELADIVQGEPDFVDAFLALPAEERDREVYALLAETLNRALVRRPQSPELHCAKGQVLDRLGDPTHAIEEMEQAVRLNPRFVRALVQLGKLYERTDRRDDAVARLEQALQLGADYADVHYLLGNLYRSQGRLEDARSAYVRALSLNNRYEAARTALAALAA